MPRRADRPRYSRLPVDERRRTVLERAARLFAGRPYGELSMSRIAREAGISKALLYHYFPSKRALFQATLRQAAEELEARTEPDPSLPPFEQLAHSVDAYLAWIELHADAYRALMSSLGEPDVRDMVEDVRTRTAERILAGIAPGGATPAMRAAVFGWLWFMDGACLEWLAAGEPDRERMSELLLATFGGALAAAGASPHPA